MKRFFAFAAISLLAAGCAPFEYQSKITVGTTTFALPKDASFDYLHASVPILTSNGIATANLVISNGVFKMNPVVLDKATQHDVAIINAAGTQVGSVLGQAVQAAAKGAKP